MTYVRLSLNSSNSGGAGLLLSVLTPTIGSRKHSFEKLQNDLNAQIRDGGLKSEVELLSACDNRERPVGAKRNDLVRAARGAYVAHVDDDDRLAPQYLKRICDTIRAHPGVDCVGLTGIISFRGKHPAKFVHSLRYPRIESREGVYVRPPMHLNPIRREIAAQYAFAEISYSEDFDWALRLLTNAALKSEALIEEPLYFYESRRHWQYQWLLDRTERARHALGLTAVNRLRLYRNGGLAQ